MSKVEKDEFRFTELDVKAGNGKIEVLMEDYANSVEEIKEIRKADRAEKLTKTELKEYRKYTGKISWLSQGTRPDLSYSALMLADLRNVNKIVGKIKKEEIKVVQEIYRKNFVAITRNKTRFELLCINVG